MNFELCQSILNYDYQKSRHLSKYKFRLCNFTIYIIVVIAIYIEILRIYDFLDIDEPEPRTECTIDEWIDIWGTLVGKARNMEDLPMWLQYYPRTLFEVINRSGIV